MGWLIRKMRRCIEYSSKFSFNGTSAYDGVMGEIVNVSWRWQNWYFPSVMLVEAFSRNAIVFGEQMRLLLKSSKLRKQAHLCKMAVILRPQFRLLYY